MRFSFVMSVLLAALPLFGQADLRARKCAAERYEVERGIFINRDRCGTVDEVDAGAGEYRFQAIGGQRFTTKQGQEMFGTRYIFEDVLDEELYIDRFEDGGAIDAATVNAVVDSSVSSMIGTYTRTPSNAKYDHSPLVNPWRVFSEKSFNYGGAEWCHAREVVLISPAGHRESDHYYRVRAIVDTLHATAFLLISSAEDDRWFDSLSLSGGK